MKKHRIVKLFQLVEITITGFKINISLIILFQMNKTGILLKTLKKKKEKSCNQKVKYFIKYLVNTYDWSHCKNI